MFQFSDLKLAQGGTEVSFPARTHLVHYDFLYHARPREASVRPFVAGGAGVRWVEATGTQQSYQPLSDLALLSHSREIIALISAGGGVKFALTPSFSLRVEVRDYISPHSFTKVIAAAPGARLHGWLHEIMPLVGLTYTR